MLKGIITTLIAWFWTAASALAGVPVITAPEGVEIEFYVVQGALFQILLAITFILLSIFLTPKPKKSKPPEIEDFEKPTADLDRPIPVVFGCVWTPGNVVAATDIGHTTHKIKA